MLKIKINYIDTCVPYRYHYVYVKTIRPPLIVGHQALKNIDWIDRDFWPDSYAYYKQVTERQINDKYMQLNLVTYRSGTTEEQRQRDAELGIGKIRVVESMPDKPLFRVPIVEGADLI